MTAVGADVGCGWQSWGGQQAWQRRADLCDNLATRTISPRSERMADQARVSSHGNRTPVGRSRSPTPAYAVRPTPSCPYALLPQHRIAPAATHVAWRETAIL